MPFIHRFVSLIIIWSFMLAASKNTFFYPIATISAKTTSSEEKKFPDLTRFLKGQDGTENPEVVTFLRENELLFDALENHKVESIPEYLIDPNHIVGQEVIHYPSDTKFQLDQLGNDIPSMAVDEIKLVEAKNSLIIEGHINGEKIISHTITGLSLISEVRDNEMVVLLDKSGSIFAIDTAALINDVFKSIIPVYKIYDNNDKAPVKFDTNKAHELTFLTRGLEPFTKDQLDQADNKLIPRDNQGIPLIESGDLVIMEKNADGKKLKAILNRKIIKSMLLQGTIELGMSAYLASHEGHGKTIGEKVENLLKVKQVGDKLAPIEELLKLVEANDIEHLPFEQDHIEPKLKGLLKTALQTFDRKQIKQSIYQAQRLADELPNDKFTVAEWYNDFLKITKQAKLENEVITERLEKGANVDTVTLKARQASLYESQQKNDYRKDYQALLLADYKQEIISSKVKELPFYKKIPYKGLSVLALNLSAAGLATWGAYEGISLLDNSISMQMHFYLNALNEKLVFHHLGTHPGYLTPMVSGILKLLMIIPAIYIYGKSCVMVMHGLSEAFKKLNVGEKYWDRMSDALAKRGFTKTAQRINNGKNRLNQISKDQSYKFSKSAQFYKNLDFRQRFITMSVRPYSRMIIPAYNHILAIMRQPTMSMLAKEINPFLKITANSLTGQAIGMSPQDKSFRMGFNSPFLSQTALKQRRALQGKAKALVMQEQKIAKDISFLMATLLIATEKDIDPATLQMLMKGTLDFDSIKKIESDPVLKAEWEYTSRSLNRDLAKIINNPDKSLLNINDADLSQYHQQFKKYANDINQNKKLTQTVNKLRNRFFINSKKTGKFFADLAQEDSQKLSSMAASINTGNQTWAAYWQDHAIVVGVTPVVGIRADLDNDPSKWAHGEGLFLDTTNQHFVDVGANAANHLIIGGPRRMLVYQIMQAMKETNYLPLDQILLQNKERTEDGMLGTKKWIKDIFFNPMESNIGAYYPRSFMKRLVTFQASLIIMVVFRIIFGEQAVDEAFMGWLLFFIGADIYFGWPWEIINRGNQMNGERIEAQLANLKEVHHRISQAAIRHDDEALIQSYNDLSKFYQTKESLIHVKINNIIKFGKKNMKSFPKINKKMANAMMKTNKTPLILGELIMLDEALKKNDYNSARNISEKLEYILDTEMSDDEVVKELKAGNFRELIEKVTNMSIKNSPIPTKANAFIAVISTFLLGAVGTSLLAVNLTVDTFNDNLLTFEHISHIFAYQMAFLSIIYTTMSERGAEFLTKNIIYPFKTIKAAIPQAASMPACQGMVDMIMHF